MAERKVGPSLFSRAGKSSTQRIQILKNTAAILSTECPKKLVPTLPFLRNLKKEEIPKEVLDDLIEKEMKRIKDNAAHERNIAESQEKQAKTSPFRSPGRDEYFFGSVRAIFRVRKMKIHPAATTTCRSTPPPGDESLPPGYYEPMPVTRKVPFPIPLRLQSERRMMLPSPSAHEKRFEILSLMPSIDSKYARSHVPDLSKSLPRSGQMISASSPHYDANKEITMQDLGKTISFTKMSSRKPLFNPISEQVEPYDVLYSQIETKLPTKNFSKMPPKDKHPTLPLPTFMQDSTSRIAIGCLSEKTIKMSCTRDSLLSPRLSPAEMLRVLNSTGKINQSLDLS